jgi:hypothetical protein
MVSSMLNAIHILIRKIEYNKKNYNILRFYKNIVIDYMFLLKKCFSTLFKIEQWFSISHLAQF